MADQAFEKILDRWIAKQEPWDLQSAIYLLLKKDPKVENDPINFDAKNSSKTETRAYTYALQAFKDPSIPLWDLSPEGAEKKSAADYLVHKRNFIDWADKIWGGDATHLVRALKRYGNRDRKPNKTQLKKVKREAANRVAFERVVAEKGIVAVRKLSYEDLWKAMREKYTDPTEDQYSASSLKNYRPNWEHESG